MHEQIQSNLALQIAQKSLDLATMKAERDYYAQQVELLTAQNQELTAQLDELTAPEKGGSDEL